MTVLMSPEAGKTMPKSGSTTTSPRQVERPAGHGRLRPPTRPRPTDAPRTVAGAACGPRRAPLPIAWLVALGVLVCVTVVGVGLLAGSGMSSVPDTTTVVRVAPGETLWDLAERAAPGSDPSAVVDRIRELNGLTDSGLRPGQPLTVPSGR